MKIIHVKALLASAVLIGGMALAASAPAMAASKKPNVLMLLTDDIGMDQLQIYGYNSTLPAPPTPNLEALQSAGLTFRNSWTMPACSTARGVLYTGRYPFRTELQAALGPSDLANSMTSPYLKTIPKLMSQAGYATALFGKFHVGLQGNNPYGLKMVNALGWQYFNGWLDETGDPSSIDTTAGGVGAPGTYPNQDKAMRSIASPNVLVVRSDIPDEAVYQITKMIWENLGTMQDIHAATKDMRLDIALKGLAAPLHPGALRYYREQGLEIPPHLLLDSQQEQTAR